MSYRPISLPPVSSKVLEKIVSEQPVSESAMWIHAQPLHRIRYLFINWKYQTIT